MNHVVAAAVTQQVQEDSQSEHEWGQDAPTSVRGVQGHARTHRHDPHPVDLRPLAAIPLAQRQVGDLVPVACQALGEVAIPALGAADREGEQAVIDDADVHGAKDAWRRLR